jgi:hypothetical protein
LREYYSEYFADIIPVLIREAWWRTRTRAPNGSATVPHGLLADDLRRLAVALSRPALLRVLRVETTTTSVTYKAMPESLNQLQDARKRYFIVFLPFIFLFRHTPRFINFVLAI